MGGMPLETELQVEKKAFKVNMDPRIYGAFAEIGAGQDVARRFFSVGRSCRHGCQDDLRV